MGGNRPVTFITIGGVRYHRDSVVEQSETTDEKGNKTYNVTLEGGTKLSYPMQEKSDKGYAINIFKRSLRAGEIFERVLPGGDRRPLVLATKPYNSGNDVSISIFGLKNATIQGNTNIGENIRLNNCHNNMLYLDDGNHKDDYNNIMHADCVEVATEYTSDFGYSKNNKVYLDYFDELVEFEDGETERHGNTVIRDEDPPQEVIDNTRTL